MKKILITGANSYIGTSFEKWVSQYPEKYSVETIDLKDGTWKDKSFLGYDVVFHVAGIAHVKETENNKELYYKVNRDLTFEVAKKAKKHGVKQFIFLSSMSVYGLEKGIICRNTQLRPKNNYGKSKLEGEKLILPFREPDFHIVILRPPMIYGKGCKGNYQKLAKISKNTMFFPKVENKRSMIYVDNLCEFIRIIINNYEDGIFLPQNEEYVTTSDMVKLIADVHGKKMWMTSLFNPILKLFKTEKLNKVFGDLLYEKEEIVKSVFSFEESIRLTEK